MKFAHTRNLILLFATPVLLLFAVACGDDTGDDSPGGGPDAAETDTGGDAAGTDAGGDAAETDAGGDAAETDAGGDAAVDAPGDSGTGEVAAQHLVFGLRGTAVGVPGTVPDIDGDGVDDDADCFAGLEIVELATGNIVGTASDCLSNVTEVGGGLSVIGTTTFELDGGTITTRGSTSVQPTTAGSVGYTNITGAIPPVDSNDVISGTGVFEGASGSVRLSGAVAMNPLESGEMEITFDCIFVLGLDRGMGNVPDGTSGRVVRLQGTAVGGPGTVPDIDGDEEDDDADCFEGLEIVDLPSGEIIGTASDCLANVTEVGDGLSLVGTTTFSFAGGTLVTRGVTSVQPTTIGSPDYTNITGAVPGPDDNDVISGTGDYEETSGPVRLSGAVAMNPLEGGDMEITFNCIFVLPLD